MLRKARKSTTTIIKKSYKNVNNNYQRTVRRPGERQDGSLRALKILNDASNDALEDDFISAA